MMNFKFVHFFFINLLFEIARILISLNFLFDEKKGNEKKKTKKQKK